MASDDPPGTSRARKDLGLPVIRRVRRGFERFFFLSAAPINLAALRVLLYSAVALFALAEDPRADAITSAVNWRPTSFFRLLPGPPSGWALEALRGALVVAAVLAALGLATRPAQLAAAPLAAFVLGFDSNFGKINHRSMLIVLLVLALAPARSGDAYSLDRLLRRGRGAPDPKASPDYRWPVALAQVTAVSVYFFAGWSKLVNGGLEWLSAESFQRFLYVRLDQLGDPPAAGLWLAAKPTLAQMAAVGSVAFELSVVAVLVWPRARLLVIPGLVVFHESTRFLVEIDFFRTLVAALIALVDYEALIKEGRRGWGALMSLARVRAGWLRVAKPS